MARPAYDIVIATDCRLPGGTSASVAEEIRAQARAGYRTGLVDIPTEMTAGVRSFNQRLADRVDAGDAELVLGDAAIETRLAVVRHPRVFSAVPTPLPPISAAHHLLVANQPPQDRTGTRIFYEPGEVADNLAASFGAAFTWAPIGPNVRDALDEHAGSLPVRDDDWVNVIDVDAWRADRSAPVAARPVIGRHGRDSWEKWPARRHDLLAAYPATDDVVVKILGGAETAERLVGGRPGNWIVYPYGARPAREFLAEIDFFVYFPHPDWIEAFGRTILEALASGAVALLPSHFETLFGDAAIYTTPDGVRPAVEELWADRDSYRDRSEAASATARERFGDDTHVARLEEIIGPPSPPAIARPATPTGPEEPSPRAASDDRDVVMFVSSNGVGVGHLMRLMAMARRAGDDIAPLFVTMSQAVSVVHGMGFPVEYVPSRTYLALDYNEWHDLLAARLEEIIAMHDPVGLVFDGTYPYRGLLRVVDRHPEVAAVWSRRAMWKPEIDGVILDEAARFDLVIEPGDFAEEVDIGPTVARRHEVTRVGPVVYLDEDELLPAVAAKKALGLNPDRPAALVQLGAGNINDITSVLGMVVHRLSEVPDLQVCLAESAISGASALDLDIHRFSVYPLAAYLHAFDFAVAASGYNTFHELIAFGVPTIFIPNLRTQADDQGARSDYAEKVGAAVSLRDPGPADFDAALARMLDPDDRRAMSETARDLFPANGAPAAIRSIEDLVRRRSADTREPRGDPRDEAPAQPRELVGGLTPQEMRWIPRYRPERVAHGLRWRARAAARQAAHWMRLSIATLLRSLEALFSRLPGFLKRPVRPVATRIFARLRPTEPAPLVLVVIEPSEPDRTDEVVRLVLTKQATSSSFRTIFLTSNDDFSQFRGRGGHFEYVMDAESWRRGPGHAPWSDYLHQRMRTLVDVHRPQHIITISRDASIDFLGSAIDAMTRTQAPDTVGQL